jgi:hypothetical protein
MNLRKAVATAAMMAVAVVGSAGVASADPVEDFCDGPRDGKAVAQRTVCPLLEGA